MFEIMVQSLDADRDFDVGGAVRRLDFDKLDDKDRNSAERAVLQAVAACIAKETKKKAILSIEKSRFIDEWNDISKALGQAVDYLRSARSACLCRNCCPIPP